MPAHLLDLSAHYNRPLRPKARQWYDFDISNLCGMALGQQRLLGVDYDIRGRVVLGAVAEAGNQPRLTDSLRMSLAPQRVAAVNLLGFAGFSDAAPGDRLAVLRLHYRDGAPAELPLRFGADFGHQEEDLPTQARVAWEGPSLTEQSRVAGNVLRAYALRLRNPHPDRAVNAIEIHTVRPIWMGLSIIAITLEPVAGMDSTRTSQRQADAASTVE